MKKSSWRRHIAAVGTGLLYGLTLRLLFGLDPTNAAWGDAFAVMSYAFVFFMPLVIGAITVVLAPVESRGNWPYWIFMPWASCAFMILASFILGWEGMLCIVFASPIMLVLASVGGVLAGLVIRRGARPKYVFASLILLPFAASPLENRLPETPSFRDVVTQITIDAPPDVVWREIIRVPEIREEERKGSLFHRIGIPKPIEATLSHEGVGALREARFEKGIVFHERVTEWEPDRSLGFTIRVDPSSIPPDALDEHVRVGDLHFDVLQGRFEIESRPGGGVILHLASRHRITTPFNWYSSFWSHRVMRDIQETICQVIKKRSERL
jgi:hypothetical protein